MAGKIREFSNKMDPEVLDEVVGSPTLRALLELYRRRGFGAPNVQWDDDHIMVAYHGGMEFEYVNAIHSDEFVVCSFANRDAAHGIPWVLILGRVCRDHIEITGGGADIHVFTAKEWEELGKSRS